MFWPKAPAPQAVAIANPIMTDFIVRTAFAFCCFILRSPSGRFTSFTFNVSTEHQARLTYPEVGS